MKQKEFDNHHKEESEIMWKAHLKGMTIGAIIVGVVICVGLLII